MNITGATRARAARDVFAREFDGEIVILDLARGEYYGLDAVGAYLWRGFERGVDIDAVAAELVEEFDVALDAARADLVTLCGDLVARKLVEIVGEAPDWRP